MISLVGGGALFLLGVLVGALLRLRVQARVNKRDLVEALGETQLQTVVVDSRLIHRLLDSEGLVALPKGADWRPHVTRAGPHGG